jgi:hypothetical protein
MNVIRDLNKSGVEVAAVVADNLRCQQLGLENMVAEKDFSQILILPCANHTLNFVFTDTMKSSMLLRRWAKHLKCLQTLLRKRPFLREFRKLCALYPEHRWIYIFDLIAWIDINKTELMPIVIAFIARGDKLIESIGLEEWAQGIPPWFAFMKSLLCPLKRLSLHLESRKASLWMIVPLVQDTVNELRALYEATDAQDVDRRKLVETLAFELIVRFRTTFNSRAARTAYVLSSLGRKAIRANSAWLVRGPEEQERHHWTRQSFSRIPNR